MLYMTSFSTKEGRLREFQDWVKKNEDVIKKSAPRGWTYRGTYGYVLGFARGHRPRVRESADLLVDLDCLQSGGQLLRAASRRRSLTSPVVDDCRARIPSLPTAMVLFVKVPSPRPRNIKGPSTNRFAVCGGVY